MVSVVMSDLLAVDEEIQTGRYGRNRCVLIDRWLRVSERQRSDVANHTDWALLPLGGKIVGPLTLSPRED